jgi:hypothetical protein
MSAQTTTTIAQLADANLFQISAPIAVNYSRSSISGAPLLSYRDAERDLSFSGEEITRGQTRMGELVTVVLDDVVDAFTRTFSLLIPVVRLPMGEEVEFTALGIEATDRSAAFVPAPGPAGVLQAHRIHQLTGIAQLVAF